MGPLEKQLVLAVNKAKASSQSKTSFSLLLLSFGKLHEGFAKINGLMLSFHDKRASESEGHAPTTKLRGKVRCSELQSRISELRLNNEQPDRRRDVEGSHGRVQPPGGARGGPGFVHLVLDDRALEGLRARPVPRDQSGPAHRRIRLPQPGLLP